MRTAFFQAIYELAENNPRIMLIVGDLGFGVAETYAKKFPQQYLNAGVAEQNMTGVAAGMALSGKIVFTYSIANFPTLRCLEQIRNDVCYHDANVKVVSIGAGFAYGSLGPTHHALEDLSILRSLPRMTVVSPADPFEAGEATRALAEHEGPAYLRLGRAGEPILHQPGARFQIGKAITVREGRDITLISVGSVLWDVLQAADVLAKEGVEARVLSMHTIKPIDEDAIQRAVEETGAIATIEEHSIIGGLGSAVAEVIAEIGNVVMPFKRIGVPSVFCSVVGDQDHLKANFGLTREGLLNVIRPLLTRKLVNTHGG